ncbi:hypothetical protein Q3G72_018357 [Acer saccharum]|nr:hypothetical protein Q3G72_018357 [Acer saccharum]
MAYYGGTYSDSDYSDSDYSDNDYYDRGRKRKYERSCILEFDGCCKGNPGRGGAGAVLRSEDDDFVLRLWEGVGDTTSNAAEYRAVILGLKYALDYNFEHICVQGDSMIVCKQIPGEWQVRNENLSILCEEARQLKDQFVSFEIEHIHREYNSEADALANKGLYLRVFGFGPSMADNRGSFYHQWRKRKQPASPRENFSRKEAFGSTSSSTIVQGGRSSGILNFDGCSKGNPGKAGAGAVLRPENGSWVLRLREGVGRATNNVAEYQALILGLRYALDYGFTHIRVQGDSLLVCKQIQGEWKIKNPNLARLCGEARELKDKFQHFKIDHVPRKVKSKPGGLRCFDAYAEGEVETRQGNVVLMLT